MQPLVASLATPADVPAVLIMMEDFNAIEAIAFDRARFAPRLERLIGDASLGGALVYAIDGAVAGYAIVTYGYDLEYGGRDAFLTELYLGPLWRGRGRGRQAIAAAEAFAARNGVHALHLLVRPDNAPARALYDRAGFVAQPRLVMTKQLG